MRYMKKTTVKAILTLGIFYFVFLGAEYLFDNMMAYATDSDGVVLAQSYILGISVIGFLLYAPLERLMTQTVQKIVRMAGMVVLIASLFVICGHISYAVTMAAGLLAFLLLGYFGSAIHYMVTRVLDDRTILARTVGVAYAFGILLQFLNNNLIHSDWAEAVFLAIATLLMVLLFYNQMQETEDGVVVSEETNEPTDKRTLWIGLLFIGIVALITFVFATLDNAVTLTHASGSVDIGQWPRLLLACSGLLAGFLYDWNQRAYMNIIMYCVMMLSTICVVVISCGGPFLLGLLVFYLSAGFFAVYFATGFMELSYYSRLPKFWAGLGRAVNNFCAVITASVSLQLLHSPSYVTVVIALILFALTSVLIFVYHNQLHRLQAEKERERSRQEETADVFALFAEEFHLTEREQEVMRCLLESDGQISDLAVQLSMSRAALYRHIGSLNEKTNTTASLGLIKFYYSWQNTRNRGGI